MSVLCKIGVPLLFVFTTLLLAPNHGARAQGDVGAEVLARLNRARAESGLPLLARNAQLDAAAQKHADDLLQNGSTLGHRGSDGSTMRQRIARAGYGAAAVGENWGAYRTLDKIMEFWLNDPSHRRNILAKKFQDIGIGVAVRPNGGLVVVTDFGAPSNDADSASVEAAPAAVPPTTAPKQAQPIQARPKATAKPKPTQPSPTVRPASKPKLEPTVVPTEPPAPPTRVALAPTIAKPSTKPMRARGKIGRADLQVIAEGASGIASIEPDYARMTLGGALMLGGTILFGVAVAGQRRRSRWP